MELANSRQQTANSKQPIQMDLDPRLAVRCMLSAVCCLLFAHKKKARAKQRGTSNTTEVFRVWPLGCPSCLAVCFTWPQVALTHHVFQLCLYRCAIGLSRQLTARRNGPV